jgi:pimeloyl-ACP methyl ester carboxylesterase
MLCHRTPRGKKTGGIYSLEKATIGGVDQWLMFRGENEQAPVMLFLHGGPGAAQIGFARRYQGELEKHFVIVNWDQRGAGLSYSRDIPRESMRIDRFIADITEIVQLIRSKIGADKVIIVGHSWGTYLGTIFSALHPDMVSAYVGVGQLDGMRENDLRTYSYLKQYYSEKDVEHTLRTLERIGPPPYTSPRDIGSSNSALLRSNAMLYSMKTWQLARTALAGPEYSILDLRRFIRGNDFSFWSLKDEVEGMDLYARVPRLKIPTYFFLGRHDHMADAELAERYYEKLETPYKELVWFENSAHCPLFEEAVKFQKELIARTLLPRNI